MTSILAPIWSEAHSRSAVSTGRSRVTPSASALRSPIDRPALRVTGRSRATSRACASSSGTTRRAGPRMPRRASSSATRSGSCPRSASFESTSAQFTAPIAQPRCSSAATRSAPGSPSRYASSADASRTLFALGLPPSLSDQLADQARAAGHVPVQPLRGFDLVTQRDDAQHTVFLDRQDQPVALA